MRTRKKDIIEDIEDVMEELAQYECEKEEMLATFMQEMEEEVEATLTPEQRKKIEKEQEEWEEEWEKRQCKDQEKKMQENEEKVQEDGGKKEHCNEQVYKVMLFKAKVQKEEKYIEARFEYVDPISEACITEEQLADMSNIIDEQYIETETVTDFLQSNILVIEGDVFKSAFKQVHVKLSYKCVECYNQFEKIDLETINQETLLEMQNHQKLLDTILMKAVEKSVHRNRVVLVCSSTIIESSPKIPEILFSDKLLKKIEPKIEKNNLNQDYVPITNGIPINLVMKFNSKKMTRINNFEETWIYTDPENSKNKIKVDGLSKVAISTSAKKLLDAATIVLTRNNFSKSNIINPQVHIDLIEYWSANGLKITKDEELQKLTLSGQLRERKRRDIYIKKLKENMVTNLRDLQKLKIEYVDKDGNHFELWLISGFYIWGEDLTINFDIDMAKYLINSYLMQYPLVLLRHDNRNPNAYAVGRRLARHHSIDQNARRGTDNTLRVSNLLKELPEISLDTKRRDWRDRIKKVLEKALDANVAIGYLTRWEYRDSKSKTLKIYTVEEADELAYDQYVDLMVDFAVAKEPLGQDERRARRENEAKQKALEKEKKPTKKRGRPKKNIV